MTRPTIDRPRNSHRRNTATPEQNLADAREFAQATRDGDAVARRRAQTRLVEGNHGLVWLYARRAAWRLGRPGVAEDLAQHGFLGLLRAIELFDAERGIPFGAYASRWVLAKVLEHIGQVESVLGVPRATRGRTPPAREAAELGRHVVSLDAQVFADGVEGEAWLDRVESREPAPDVAAERGELEAWVDGLMARALSERDEGLMRGRFWGGETLAASGRRLGVSRERARQLEERAVGRLRVRARAAVGEHAR